MSMTEFAVNKIKKYLDGLKNLLLPDFEYISKP
jgi:hypothetical protein